MRYATPCLLPAYLRQRHALRLLRQRHAELARMRSPRLRYAMRSHSLISRHAARVCAERRRHMLRAYAATRA